MVSHASWPMEMVVRSSANALGIVPWTLMRTVQGAMMRAEGSHGVWASLWD